MNGLTIILGVGFITFIICLSIVWRFIGDWFERKHVGRRPNQGPAARGIARKIRGFTIDNAKKRIKTK